MEPPPFACPLPEKQKTKRLSSTSTHNATRETRQRSQSEFKEHRRIGHVPFLPCRGGGGCLPTLLARGPFACLALWPFIFREAILRDCSLSSSSSSSSAVVLLTLPSSVITFRYGFWKQTRRLYFTKSSRDTTRSSRTRMYKLKNVQEQQTINACVTCLSTTAPQRDPLRIAPVKRRSGVKWGPAAASPASASDGRRRLLLLWPRRVLSSNAWENKAEIAINNQI